MTNSVNYSDTDYENKCMSFEELEDLENWMGTRQTMQSSQKFSNDWIQEQEEDKLEAE